MALSVVEHCAVAGDVAGVRRVLLRARAPQALLAAALLAAARTAADADVVAELLALDSTGSTNTEVVVAG